MTEVATTPATTPTPWTTGLDTELVGSVQNRGWDKLAPDAAAREAVKAHKELERINGVPIERIVKLPAAGAEAKEWTPVYERLGTPKEAKDYDFSQVKRKDGKPVDEALITAVRNAAFKAHATKDGAVEIAKDVVAHYETIDTSKATVTQAEMQAEQVKLRTNWGAQADAQLIVAKRVAEVFGLTQDQITALQGQAGYANVMIGLANIGARIGEDKFIRVGGDGGNGVMTPEQAVTKKRELMADPVWGKAFLEGDAAKKREWDSLIAIEVSGKQ